MSTRTLARTRNELSDFLVHHRKKLSTADVGLPNTGRRRTSGLRREEVAALAGVGLTWYTWFEQGRDIQVSEAFLLNVSKALRLDDAECCHLFLLAHRRPPPAEAFELSSVSPLVQQLMDDLVERPAYVINLHWDVIAWNRAADSLFGFATRERVHRNFMRMIFADPASRRRFPNWHQDAPRLHAQFRYDLAAAPASPAALTLIEDLVALSPDFRRGMEQSHVDSYGRGISAILDADDNRHEFIHDMLTVDEHRHLRMVVYFSRQGPR
ncbi:XRE family transcriptional regulator [Phyllobacterium salinisoli]|uniref:XRE family transcriptional regulator n=1 Tax=Phyllobacterium salinisoli TaxID=1899321 RepID=A0A368K0B5_9HYPH|nr:helix-turn-helix transcriptional regulator [Phyllobacterium salinisoli]RCS22838.1 XRE family transcriptional regulator [Phyllobacterium salinisoli]